MIHRTVVSYLLIAVFAAGCGTSVPSLTTTASPPSMTALAHYSGGELSFDYPSAWNQATFDEVSSFSRVITFLSTDPLSEPCTTRVNSMGTETDCGLPIGERGLASDGVLVTWLGRAFPGWTFDPTSGTLGQVGGKTATIEDQAAGDECAGVGGTVRQMIAIIPRPDAESNWYEMDGCYAGPDLSVVSAQLQAMLDSVQWAPNR